VAKSTVSRRLTALCCGRAAVKRERAYLVMALMIICPLLFLMPMFTMLDVVSNLSFFD